MRSGLVLSLAVFGTVVANAQITLTHNGSSVDLNENTATINNWFLNGVDQVFANRWYFRDGDAGTAALISTISAPAVTLLGTRGAEVVYADNNLTVTVTYLLQASSNGHSADLAEQVTVESNFGIDLRLFQYNDFDIDGSAGGDTVVRLNSSSISQSDSGTSVTEGGTPIPDFSEIRPWAGFGLDDDITSTVGYNLNTAAGSGIGQTANGDMTFAYQWNKSLGDGGAFSVSTDKAAAVPEPTSIAALGLGALALLRRRKKKA